MIKVGVKVKYDIYIYIRMEEVVYLYACLLLVHQVLFDLFLFVCV
jgi:hypothetical protein